MPERVTAFDVCSAPDRQLEVQLNGGALELAPEGVKDRNVDLGPVERSICLI